MTSSDMPVRSGDRPRLTPGEVQSVTFPRAPLGRRGVDEERVKAFLRQVERELAQILQERTALGDEVARLRRHVGGSGGGGLLPAEDAHIQAVRVLSQAQQTADRHVEDAERYSRELAQEARRNRDEILADARARAALVLEEAHRQATSAAAAVFSSGEPANEAPMPPGERRELEREIAYLRTFSDVYRGHLKSYLEALLRNVEEWERSEAESLSDMRRQSSATSTAPAVPVASARDGSRPAAGAQTRHGRGDSVVSTAARAAGAPTGTPALPGAPPSSLAQPGPAAPTRPDPAPDGSTAVPSA